MHLSFRRATASSGLLHAQGGWGRQARREAAAAWGTSRSLLPAQRLHGLQARLLGARFSLCTSRGRGQQQQQSHRRQEEPGGLHLHASVLLDSEAPPRKCTRGCEVDGQREQGAAAALGWHKRCARWPPRLALALRCCTALQAGQLLTICNWLVVLTIFHLHCIVLVQQEEGQRRACLIVCLLSCAATSSAACWLRLWGLLILPTVLSMHGKELCEQHYLFS